MGQLRTLTITTQNGDQHVFPCVDWKDSSIVFKSLGSGGTFTLVNAGGACLTLPFRTVDSIEAEGEVLWKRPIPANTSAA